MTTNIIEHPDDLSSVEWEALRCGVVPGESKGGVKTNSEWIPDNPPYLVTGPGKDLAADLS